MPVAVVGGTVVCVLAASTTPLVIATADAVALATSEHAWRRALAGGAWHRLAHGVWCRQEAWDTADRVTRTRLVAVAHHRRWPGSVVSHLSSAAMWGLPLPLAPRDAQDQPYRAWLTVPSEPGRAARRTPVVVVTMAALAPADVERVGPSVWGAPIAVTTRSRTVVDCLRALPAHDAVAIADAAARRGTTRAVVDAVLDRQVGWPRTRRAQDLLGLVDPRRESWLESVSAVSFHELGLPPGEPQVEVRTPGGRFVARVDTCWRGLGVVGEADGWAKYTADDSSPDGARRALRSEKQREDALRDLGLEVVRWDTGGVLDPARRAATAERFHRAVARADPYRVRARLLAAPLPAGWVAG